MQKQNIKSNRKIKIQVELKRLKKEFAKVKPERTILEKCAGYLQSRTQMKFEFIDQHLFCFTAKDMCSILYVSVS